MELKDQIKSDLKVAMREKDTDTRNTLRMMQAAIKQVEIDGGEPLDNDGVLSILQKQAKMRRESIDEYEKGGRAELAAGEKTELAVIEKYLPQMMSREEIEVIAQGVLADLGVSDMKSMGRIMGAMMPKVKGKADGKLVNEVVRSLLS